VSLSRARGIILVDGTQTCRLGDHAGDLPAEPMSLLVIAGDPKCSVDQGADGTEAHGDWVAGVTNVALGVDGLCAAQAQATVGNDGAGLCEYLIHDRTCHEVPPSALLSRHFNLQRREGSTRGFRRAITLIGRLG
jgi:hypothetical protein